jgi:hypothetical protein
MSLRNLTTAEKCIGLIIVALLGASGVWAYQTSEAYKGIDAEIAKRHEARQSQCADIQARVKSNVDAARALMSNHQPTDEKDKMITALAELLIEQEMFAMPSCTN